MRFEFQVLLSGGYLGVSREAHYHEWIYIFPRCKSNKVPAETVEAAVKSGDAKRGAMPCEISVKVIINKLRSVTSTEH